MSARLLSCLLLLAFALAGSARMRGLAQQAPSRLQQDQQQPLVMTEMGAAMRRRGLLTGRQAVPVFSAAPQTVSSSVSSSGIKNEVVVFQRQRKLLRGADNTNIATLYMPATGTPKADIIFFHGFADCRLNHDALFKTWTKGGYNVIAFDFPGHGASGGDINSFCLEDLSTIGAQVLKKYRTNPRLPLYAAGWSTGGLAAIRDIQSTHALPPIQKAFFITPGVVVRAIVGDLGSVTAATLTRNPTPNYRCPIKPTSPFKAPIFAATLAGQSVLSITAYPKVPTLVLVAGDDDRYVDTEGVIKWVKNHNVFGVQCAGAFHDLDNEVQSVSNYVHQASLQFFNDGTVLKSTSCSQFA